MILVTIFEHLQKIFLDGFNTFGRFWNNFGNFSIFGRKMSAVSENVLEILGIISTILERFTDHFWFFLASRMVIQSMIANVWKFWGEFCLDEMWWNATHFVGLFSTLTFSGAKRRGDVRCPFPPFVMAAMSCFNSLLKLVPWPIGREYTHDLSKALEA